MGERCSLCDGSSVAVEVSSHPPIVRPSMTLGISGARARHKNKVVNWWTVAPCLPLLVLTRAPPPRGHYLSITTQPGYCGTTWGWRGYEVLREQMNSDWPISHAVVACCATHDWLCVCVCGVTDAEVLASSDAFSCIQPYPTASTLSFQEHCLSTSSHSHQHYPRLHHESCKGTGSGMPFPMERNPAFKIPCPPYPPSKLPTYRRLHAAGTIATSCIYACIQQRMSFQRIGIMAISI